MILSPAHAVVGDTSAVIEEGKAFTSREEEEPDTLPEQPAAVAVNV